MIIFGWRTIVNTIGAVFKKMCDHCHNEDYWILTKTTRWFTLFFIPVIPTETRYFLACPVCKYGFNLNGNQVKSIKPLAEINQQFIEGKISQTEHAFKINQLNGETTNSQSTPKVDVAQILAESHQERIYCGSCGNKIDGDSKFCGICGTAITTT